MFTVNRNPSPKDLRQFAVVMLVGFIVIGALIWLSSWLGTWDRSTLPWSGTSRQLAAVSLAALGAVVCLVTLSSQVAGRWIYVVWMTGATRVGIVMSTIMLSAMFLILLPVFSLVVRLGDPLRKKLSASPTYWEDYKPHEATIDRLRRPF